MWGRIVSSVSNALDINLATLSGCIDIIAVVQPDGTLRSSPFHVRFGKAKLLRSREKVVVIRVNDEDITDLIMKLGAAGEAFFVEEVIDEDGLMSPNEFVDFTSSAAPGDSDEEKSTIYRSLPVDTSNELFEADAAVLTDDNLYSSNNDVLMTNSDNTYESRVQFSLCGHLLIGLPEEIDSDEEAFLNNIVDWETLDAQPEMWYNPSMVVRFDGAGPVYPSKIALPLICSWVAFNRPISISAVRQLLTTTLVAEPSRDKTFLGWIFGGASNRSTNSPKTRSQRAADNSNTTGSDRGAAQTDVSETRNTSTLKNTPGGVDESTFYMSEESTNDGKLIPPRSTISCCSVDGRIVKKYKKSFRPNSEQLAKLRLKPGANKIEFSVSSSLQGCKSVCGTVYLWPSTAKIIVSDVDGTITRSDVWGQLMPIVGHDWSHDGVADFFSKIHENGYHLLYLSARAVGQADSTREYLFGLTQNDRETLPDGPLVLSPDRLFFSFKREVIDRKPYVFKIAALKDIRNLFPATVNPYFAGFGNKDTDYRAYVHIGIPESKIFIIDPTGVIHHINKTYAKTYETLSAITERMFPPTFVTSIADSTKLEVTEDAQFNSCNFWSQHLPTQVFSSSEHMSESSEESEDFTNDNIDQTTPQISELQESDEFFAAEMLRIRQQDSEKLFRITVTGVPEEIEDSVLQADTCLAVEESVSYAEETADVT